MSMWWWISWYLLEVVGWTNCATIDYIWVHYPCDWTSVPVIGLITPVIGLRSLWLDFGPCDLVFTPAYLTSDWGWVWYDGWCEDWWLVLGVLSWFMYSWVPCVYSIDILWILDMVSWFLYGCCSVGILVMDSLSCTFVLNIGFVWMSLGLWFVQFIVVEYPFELLNSLLVFIFYMCVWAYLQTYVYLYLLVGVNGGCLAVFC